MTQSMTSYASKTGASGATSWQWEIRGVNARGLDLRIRMPEGVDGLEADVRRVVGKSLSRGNVTLNLRLTTEESQQALGLDEAQLDRVLTALDTVQERAFAMGVTLGQPTAADVLNTRGVVVGARSEALGPDVMAALRSDFDELLTDFCAMRATEGAALEAVIAAQLDEIEQLTVAATTAASDRRSDAQASLSAALRRVLDDVPEIEDSRIAQELALLAVKADIVEELDRLTTHVAAARSLLTDQKPSGRKLDFLCQEFNREANTVCSKAGSAKLTSIGLDLKAVIDQMREQIQNVE